MSIIITSCSCSGTPAADFQDKTYGKGQRVHNSGFTKGQICTVCAKSLKGSGKK